MTTADVQKFVEEDYKDFVIMITCDNEHKFYHNASGNPPIIWDWDNERFYSLEPNPNILDQNKHPMQVTMGVFADIQFLTAYIDKKTSLKFIEENIFDEDKEKETKTLLYKLASNTMGPRTLRKNIDDPEFRA